MTRRTTPRRSRPRAHRRRGAAAVEFAIAAILLLLIVFASIEFVRLNMMKHGIEHASYLAARSGIIVGAKSSDVKTAAEDHLNLLGISNATVTVNPNTIDDETTVIEVIVDVPMTGSSGISPVHFTGTVTGRTRMLAERSAAVMSGASP